MEKLRHGLPGFQEKTATFVPNDTTENRIRTRSDEGTEVIQMALNYDIT
ncbi:MAG: hypothetical protein GX128_05725 [Bacteroidales bacterium]|jgi:hypothetical protein|nr:hypothetical protein [Bacteroidales bacterium]